MAKDSASKPMYEQIFESLRERIQQHQYKIGDRVPSEKELCDEFGVSRITTKKALEMLVNEQLIVRQPGRGSFVADTALEESGRGATPAANKDRSRKVDCSSVWSLPISAICMEPSFYTAWRRLENMTAFLCLDVLSVFPSRRNSVSVSCWSLG